MGEQYKCDVCGAPATVHLTQIADGKIRKVHLCEKCAAKGKIAELPILKFTEMLAETLASGGNKPAREQAADEAFARAPEKVCPDCGMTDLAFARSHRLGCPRCYDVFAEDVAALLPGVQRGGRYRGDAGKTGVSAPAKKRKPAAEKLSLAALRERLKTAVSQEDYALAAQLRDEIRAAEKKPSARAKKSPAASAEKKPPRRSRAVSSKKSSGEAKP
ncbi:MAG TPA: UvrB/UvrC motif-containing protein [Candidatus Spyradosoma merdigallinarum]|uniref:UvrB/UvrC motif-containing protein n=1 Tax=Candidatus Spyradosoma merdigallinarum TaxID=2840950 RepID=A0A9D1T254_9BACT|nr:UvrB/UvrC motif-containing protein [Candidatus Spyradosoma merdigallinarum]